MPKIPDGFVPKSAPNGILKPFWTTSDKESLRLYLGETRAVLRRMKSKSVHCCVTSPPYWGLRDYGTGTWEGGSETCDHKSPGTNRGERDELPNPSAGWAKRAQEHKNLTHCLKCGARRVDEQIGSEPSPDCGTMGKAQCGGCFVCTMVDVFREVKRVLRDDGTLWINLGDTYANTGACGGSSPVGDRNYRETDRVRQESMKRTRKDYNGISAGNLVGAPWRVALALQADGWILRQDIIWHKVAPMPESVTNRCTKSHEYVFLLVKKMGYFYDNEAIRERTGNESSPEEYARLKETTWKSGGLIKGAGGLKPKDKVGHTPPSGRNKRSVWTVTPGGGYSGAHYATFGPKLIEPMIKAGTSEHGCCSGCGTPWVRVVEKTGAQGDDNEVIATTKSLGSPGGNGDPRVRRPTEATYQHTTRATGDWRPNCECNGKLVEERKTVKVMRRKDDEDARDRDHSMKSNRNGKGSMSLDDGVEMEEREETVKVIVYKSDFPLDEHPVSPCVTLDPFVGSGTVCDVSIGLGRNSVGIDLSETYLRDNAIHLIMGAWMSRTFTKHLVPMERKHVEIGGRKLLGG